MDSRKNNEETLPLPIPPDDSAPPQPIPTAASTPIEEMIVTEAPSPKRKGCARAWVPWVLIALTLLCTIAVLSGGGGYMAGNRMRKQAEEDEIRNAAQTQFAMAMLDIDSGRFRLLPTRMASFRQWSADQRDISPEAALELQVQFELARIDVNEKRYEAARARLEWIIEWNPGYPGVTDLLAEALYQASITATPTLAPTLTPVPPTPTPDTRGIEKLFSDAQEALLGGNWTVAIDTLLTLRKRDPTYNAVKVDGMLYVALRYRGQDKIKGSGKTDVTITKVDLEGGMYDLKLAENFGPLDVDALKYRRWAQWYISGSSFWNVDWQRAVEYYALVSNEAPYLVDINGWPAIERYRYALIQYANQLAAMGDCAGSSEQYQKALALGPNPQLEATATAAADSCGPAKPQETPSTPIVETPATVTPISTEGLTPTPPPEATPVEASPTPPATIPPETTPIPTSTQPPAEATPTPAQPTSTDTQPPPGDNPTNTPTP